MIREQDVVVFQGCGDERSALGPSISHPVKNKSELHKYCSTKCRNIDFKRLFNGSNNPMYGKKWSDSARLR